MRSIRDVNVAVPGGAGFLGSHVVNHLIEDRGCKVLVIDNFVAGRPEFIHPMAEFSHHDITGSEDHLRRLFERHKIRFAFNYAARPYVPDSYDRPVRTFDVNAIGALKVINAAQEAGCEAILQVSSAEIYGSAGETKYDPNDGEPYSHGESWPCHEGSEVVPHSTYGAAKAAIDALVQVRWREAGTPCIALRQFNCTGENDILHEYVIPVIVRQLADQATVETPTIRLGNNSSRDFLYAGDQARLSVELLEKGELGEVYNLGSETSIKIYDLAKLIFSIMYPPEKHGKRTLTIEEDPARVRKWEIWHLQSDNSKLYSVIEGRPQVPLEEALRRTIDDLLVWRQKGVWK